MKKVLFLAGLFVLAACTSCTDEMQKTASATSSAALSDQDKDFFQKVTVNAGETFTKGNLAWTDRYSPDAIVMVPHMESLKGMQAIREYGLSFPPVHLELSVVEMLGTSHHANVLGKYVINDSTGKLLDKGKFVNIWQKDPTGKWSMTHDIWNSDVPLPAEKN